MLRKNVEYKVIGVERYTDLSIALLKRENGTIIPCLFDAIPSEITNGVWCKVVRFKTNDATSYALQMIH